MKQCKSHYVSESVTMLTAIGELFSDGCSRSGFRVGVFIVLVTFVVQARIFFVL